MGHGAAVCRTVGEAGRVRLDDAMRTPRPLAGEVGAKRRVRVPVPCKTLTRLELRAATPHSVGEVHVGRIYAAELRS